MPIDARLLLQAQPTNLMQSIAGGLQTGEQLQNSKLAQLMSQQKLEQGQLALDEYKQQAPMRHDEEFNKYLDGKFKSDYYGAMQILPMLDSGNVDGAQKYMAQHIAQGKLFGADMTDEEEFLNGLKTNPQQAKQHLSDIVSFGKQLYGDKNAGLKLEQMKMLMGMQNNKDKLDETRRYHDATIANDQEKTAILRDKARLLAQNPPDNYANVSLDDAGQPWGFNKQTKQYEKVPVSADGLPKKEKPLTETQGNATAFGMRATAAANTISNLEKNGTYGNVSTLSRGLENIPVVGGAVSGVAHAALSTDQQKYEQAAREFIAAVLRKESGASISPAEFNNFYKIYFPQPGEGDDVKLQKAAARTRAIDSLRVQAGKGAEQFPASGKDYSTMSDEELMKELTK